MECSRPEDRGKSAEFYKKHGFLQKLVPPVDRDEGGVYLRRMKRKNLIRPATAALMSTLLKSTALISTLLKSTALLSTALISAALISAALLQGCDAARIKDGDGDYGYSAGDLYASAVCFPDGYDWVQDNLGGEVPVELMLLKGKTVVGSIKVPSDHCGAAADMHHICDGRLIAGIVEGEETLVKDCSGTIMHIGQDEQITDAMIIGDDLYTLSTSTADGCIRYRRNEEVLLRCSNAALLGGLHLSGGKLCWAYSESLVSTGSSTLTIYYFVQDGQAAVINYSGMIDKVLCARMFDGSICFLGRARENPAFIIWQQGNSLSVIDTSPFALIRDYSILQVGEELLAHAQVLPYDGSGWADYYWMKGGVKASTESGNEVCAFCKDAPVLFYAQSPKGKTSPVTLNFGEKIRKLPSKYRLVSPYALCCGERDYFIALTDRDDGNRPVIIHENDTLRYDFNGYFTHLALP